MLKSLVELKGSKWTSCHDHNKEIEFICISDRLRICGECAIMGLHQGHEIKLIDQLYIEINEKTKLLETKLDQVKTHHKDLSGMLELEKETMLISLRSKFEILDRILKMKEEELVNDINIFFEKEKITLDEALGEESSFKRKIEENLHILKNGSSEVNMIEVIEDQSFETEVNLEDQNFEKCYVRSNEKLKEISKSLNSFIDLQIQATQQLTFPLKNFSLIAF